MKKNLQNTVGTEGASVADILKNKNILQNMANDLKNDEDLQKILAADLYRAKLRSKTCDVFDAKVVKFSDRITTHTAAESQTSIDYRSIEAMGRHEAWYAGVN